MEVMEDNKKICFFLLMCFTLAVSDIRDARVVLSRGCAAARLGTTSYSGSTTIPIANWADIPSVYEVQPGEYRVFGRIVHMNYLKEQLEHRGVSFDGSRLATPPQVSVEVQADTVYIQDPTLLFGLRRLKMFTRVIIGGTGSLLDISAPTWDAQVHESSVTAKHGFDGPTVEIFADEIQGAFRIVANGGNGLRGKDGADGRPGSNNDNKEPDIRVEECTSQRFPNCETVLGTPGRKGRPGTDGGDAGPGGDGGNAGTLRVLVTRVDGNAELKSCRGTGAQAGTRGRGGQGGLGSIGGKGVICGASVGTGGFGFGSSCVSGGQTPRAARGPRGNPGVPGNAAVSGTPGSVSQSVVRSSSLDAPAKGSYPVPLLRLMKRHAEDLLRGNDLTMAKKVLKFVKLLTADRADARDIYKEAKRRLVFAGKEGFDMFGNNKLFAPRIKWEVLKTVVEDIREYATDYENSYNNMRQMIENEENVENLQQLANSVANIQIQAEKERLIEARHIAVSEKALYARAIQSLEDKMDNIITHIRAALPDVHWQAQFDIEDLLGVLQGVAGFASGVSQKDAFAVIERTADVAQDLTMRLNCPTGSLEAVLGNLRRWLTFGSNYDPLEDSSDLDFDQVDIESVPEMMQANLEINKEGLAAQLVCFLDVRTREQDAARIKKLIEQFFINAASRIDFIGKIIDLDNEMGGHNFDIPLLEETQQSLTSVNHPEGLTATDETRVQFLEHLLSTYQELEGSFMKEVYELYKAFQFNTLWEANDPLPEFQRVASEGARGGRLNGIHELTNVLRNIQSLEASAVTCFSRNHYSTAIQRWSFNTTTHESMFNDLRSGGASAFTLDIANTCPTCFNQRLMKLYIEFKGSQAQPDTVPDKVHFLIRHKGASFFRVFKNGVGYNKEYRQPLGSFRKMKFRRFAVSDQKKCREQERRGNRNSIYCVTPNDYRFQPMCNHPTSQGACADSLLGEEECRSPFGTYELIIPVDNQLSCDAAGMTNRNCRDLELSKFDTMNVWALFYYWPDAYPDGPDHRLCL